jgi:hypothetical protein
MKILVDHHTSSTRVQDALQYYQTMDLDCIVFCGAYKNFLDVYSKHPLNGAELLGTPYPRDHKIFIFCYFIKRERLEEFKPIFYTKLGVDLWTYL